MAYKGGSLSKSLAKESIEATISAMEFWVAAKRAKSFANAGNSI